MIEVPPGDDKLDVLVGRTVPSGAPNVGYQILKRVGAGGSSIAFLAVRIAQEGRCPVVLKVLRPSIVRMLGERALLVVSKEAVSLRRLNEHVPPTPFVVRFIDSGTIRAARNGKTLDLAWLAVEHVHGGPEGTTLTDRVVHSLQTTGAAFEPTRALIAVEHVARGLHAVHEVGVIHRDMKPDNVLVCGTGEDEIFKLADFGIARPQGGTATFGAVVGTPGYAGPELSSLDPESIGPWTDVFGFACIVFFLLTGEPYFPFASPAEAITLIRRPDRRSVLSAKSLSPELQNNLGACKAIDLALARATAPNYQERTQSAVGLCAEVVPHLRGESRRPRPSTRRPDLAAQTGAVRDKWSFQVVHRAVPGFFVRDVAWHGDGRCLAATNRGLSFWDGTAWRDAPVSGFSSPHAIRFVARSGSGEWLVGGEGGTFARFTTEGVRDVVRGDPGTRFDKYAGDLEDLAVFVGSGPGGPQTLFALIGRRWAKPLVVRDLQTVHGLARFEDTRWLLVGTDAAGKAYAAVYSPLDREVDRLPDAGARAFFASAGKLDTGRGMVAGTGGAVISWEAGKPAIEPVPGGFDLSAAAIDPFGRGWVASAGRVWRRRSSASERWRLQWEDPTLSAAIISLLPDIGLVRAVMADGTVVEGTTPLGQD
jgi:serine/threonine protein kinase